MTGSLSGRTILDCSTLLPGPFIGKLAAEAGARVLKIEHPERPDGARALGHFYDDLNSLKEIVKLDLGQEPDRGRFRSLVREANGLIEAFRPAAKIRLGLDEATLLGLNPGLCVVSIVGYPETGPLRERAGHDLNFQALSGSLSLAEGMPNLPMADLLGAYRGAFELSALLHREAKTGKGGRAVVSLQETLLQAQSPLFADHRANDVTFLSGAFPSYRVYRSSDGRRIAVGAIEAKFWDAFCRVIGLSGAEGHGFAGGDRGRDLISEVETRLAAKPWSHWRPLFEAADCCVEPVLDYDEVRSFGV